jgi:hypothetical protein
MQPACTTGFNTLYDQGQYLLRNKYRAHTDHVVEEAKFFGLQFDEDAQNKAFGDAVQKLFLDLGNDESGKTVFKPHLLKDVTEVILPTLLASAHYIPIPRMEYSDPKVDVIIENLVVESDNLAPNVFEFGSDNHWKWGRKAGNKSSNKNKVLVAVSGVQMDLRDVSFYINRKQGFPSIKDQGLCDIIMGGEGFSFKMQMETVDKKDRKHFFNVSKVKVSVKNFNINLKKSKHKLLFMLAKPLLLRAMKPALQKVLEAAIKQKATELDEVMYEVYQEAQKAERDARNNPDPENVKSIYQQYWAAANRRLAKAKENKAKLDKSMENKQFNMAMTKQDSLFPSIDLPSGISTKATEYKELAAKGDRWESPVFSMGSAKPSTNIPSAPSVTRKHHSPKPPSVGFGNGTNAGVGGVGSNGATTTSFASNGATSNDALHKTMNGYGQQAAQPGSEYGHPGYEQPPVQQTSGLAHKAALGQPPVGYGQQTSAPLGQPPMGYAQQQPSGFGQQVDRAFDPAPV